MTILTPPFDPSSIEISPDCTTLSGGIVRYDMVQDPLLENIKRRDIARGLARTFRFGGQTYKPYSVAEHSLYVAKLVKRWAENNDATSTEVRAATLFALLHDAHEAFMCDLPTPLKRRLAVESLRYETVAGWMDQQIRASVGLFDHMIPLGTPGLVKAADRVALLVEDRDLRRGNDHPYLPSAHIVPVDDMSVTEQMFFDELNALAYTDSGTVIGTYRS